MDNPIGVFDSGIGGLTVLKELTKMLPLEDFIYIADSSNAPYGHRKRSEIMELSSRIVNILINKSCKLIVIACNTATAATVNDLRKKYKTPIIGLEPAVKPACLNTKTKNIGVLATEGTFRGNHFKNTSEKYKDYVKIHLQVAKGLVDIAEKGTFLGDEVTEMIKKYVEPLKEHNIDQLVLGCTHYPLFKETIKKIAGEDINIIDSGEAVARRTKDVLMTNKILNTKKKKRKLQFYSTKKENLLLDLVPKIFNSDNNDIKIEYINSI